MSEIRTFFRFCPECGRRFHIKLVSKKLVGVERESEERRQAFPVGIPANEPSAGSPVIVEETEGPMTIDIEEFQYTYRCKHCGHEWTEKHLEEEKE